ncbi:MAG: hypothetical protein U0175_37450 [Caldilineaceae bacterium]
MKITLNISLKDNSIVADAPETAFHEEFANLVLMEKTQNKLLGMGVSLEEAERTAPKEFAAQKQNLVVLPAFSNEDFKVNITYSVVHLLAASAYFHNRSIFSASLFGTGSISCNLLLPGYEQIPTSLRDLFEYQLLSNRIIGTKRKFTQLIINNKVITELNQEIDKKEKRYRFERKLAELLIGSFTLTVFVVFLWIIGVTVLPVFRSVLYNLEGQNYLLIILLIALSLLVLLSVIYVSDLVAQVASFVLLRLIVPSERLKNIAKQQTYRAQSVKRMVDKLFTE